MMMMKLALLGVVCMCALTYAAGDLTTVDTQIDIDPRLAHPDGALAGVRNAYLSYVQWYTGKKYRFRFLSKATHMEVSLPIPSKVNPQTSLEDMGLFPFAVLQGGMTLECLCINEQQNFLFKVSVFNITNDCGQDVTRSSNDCNHLDQVARDMKKYPFWLYMNVKGEITNVLFSNNDSKEIAGIKKNLVASLTMSTPDSTKYELPQNFVKQHQYGEDKFTTRYRIYPFTRHAHSTGQIDGVLVRKEKSIVGPSRLGRSGTIPYERKSWVYMVIGGDIEASSGPAPVPTHVASMEEVQIDPSYVAKHHQGDLFILSRLVLDLRTIRPGLAIPSDQCHPSYAVSPLAGPPEPSLLQLDSKDTGQVDMDDESGLDLFYLRISGF